MGILKVKMNCLHLFIMGPTTIYHVYIKEKKRSIHHVYMNHCAYSKHYRGNSSRNLPFENPCFLGIVKYFYMYCISILIKSWFIIFYTVT